MLRRKLQKKFPDYLEILCIIFLGFCLKGSAADSLLPANEKIPALIVFGDSIMDPGNNNYIKTLVKCDFPPYGRDFNGGSPTGRFSNGKIPSDFIGQPGILFFVSYR